MFENFNVYNMLIERLCNCCSSTVRPGLVRSCIDCLGIMLVSLSAPSVALSESSLELLQEIFDGLINGSLSSVVALTDSGNNCDSFHVIVILASFASRYLYFCCFHAKQDQCKHVIDGILWKIASQSDNGFVVRSFVMSIVHVASKFPTDLFNMLLHTDMKDLLDFGESSERMEQWKMQSAFGFFLDQWSEVHDNIDDEYIGKISFVSLLRLIEFLVDLALVDESSSRRNFAISNKILRTVIHSAVDLVESDENQENVHVVFEEDDDEGFDDDVFCDEEDEFDDEDNDDRLENVKKSPFVARDQFLKEMYGISDENEDDLDSQTAGNMLESAQASSDHVMLFADRKHDTLWNMKTVRMIGSFVEDMKNRCHSNGKLPSWINLPNEELQILQSLSE